MTLSNADIEAAWARALEVWDTQVTLSPPVALDGDGQDRDWPGDEPLAFIDMTTRQVVVNYALLEERRITHTLEAILAHEIGHHVRYPQTLGLMAQLQVLEQRLLPQVGQSLSNLFFDLQVNEFVGRTHRDAIGEIYTTFALTSSFSAVFAFYLAIYEELWAMPIGSLSGPTAVQQMDANFPAWRGEARMFAQTFYALGDVFLQFVYFCSRFARYIGEPGKLSFNIPLSADVPRPDEDDFAAAIVGSRHIDDALERAAEQGWIDPAKARGAMSEDVFSGLDAIFGAGHGRGAAAFRKAVFTKHYRRLVDQHLLDAPPSGERPEPDLFLPTTTTPWEPGADTRHIDWIQSVVYAGPLAAATPLLREREPDELPEAPQRFPSIEIYVDTSGSMPNPTHGLNVMTLSGLVLAASALRKEGRVRGVIYSDGKPITSDWIYAENRAFDFFMHFAGGGTYFPFDTLTKLAEDDSDCVRVIISDSGFNYDLGRDGALDAFRAALDATPQRVVLLLWHWSEHYIDNLREVLGPLHSHPHLRVTVVTDLRDMASTARDLGRALFGDT